MTGKKYNGSKAFRELSGGVRQRRSPKEYIL